MRAAVSVPCFGIDAALIATDGGDPARLERYGAHREAGATWWVEAVHPWRYGRVEGGP